MWVRHPPCLLMKFCEICESEMHGTKRKFCSKECQEKSGLITNEEKRNSYHYQTIRGLKRKLYLIDLRGGKCEKCDYKKNLAAFDFHHKDPSTKEFKLDSRNLSNFTMEKILVEFEKCEVLCSNCHRELHNEDSGIDEVRKYLEQFELESSLEIRTINKPVCCDCQEEINYGSSRCKACDYKLRRKVIRPNLEILANEVKEKSRV